MQIVFSRDPPPAAGETSKFHMADFLVNQTYRIEFGEKTDDSTHVRVNRAADAEQNLAVGWRVAAASAAADIKTMTRCSSRFPPGPPRNEISVVLRARAGDFRFFFFLLLYYIFFYLRPEKQKITMLSSGTGLLIVVGFFYPPILIFIFLFYYSFLRIHPTRGGEGQRASS